MKKNILKLKLRQIFLKHKLSKKHAEISSDYLIKAEILEAKGHGLARLKMYCDRLKKRPHQKRDCAESRLLRGILSNR